MKTIRSMKRYYLIMAFMSCALVSMAQTVNKIYFEPTDLTKGKESTISLQMTSEAANIVGFQFDLYLPEGVTITYDENGYENILLSTSRTTSSRHDGFRATLQDDGAWRILCYSTSLKTFKGTEGEVCTIALQADKYMDEQEYPVYIRNANLTCSDYSSINLTDLTLSVNVVPGDPDLQVTIDGLTYGLDAEKKEAILLSASTDNAEINVPLSVTYEEEEYTLTSIRKGAFTGCSAATSMIVAWDTPFAINAAMLNGIDKSACTLFVPKGSILKYARADEWKEFINIVEVDKSINGDMNGDGVLSVTDVGILITKILTGE